MTKSIRCKCGQRISIREVLSTGYLLRLATPPYIYIRFRCPRCRKLGEQYLAAEQWDAGLLTERHSEASPKEKQRFRELGPITVEELVDFHFQLDKLEALDPVELLGQEAEII